PRRGPVGITYPLKIHFKEAYRLPAGQDPVANFLPASVLDNCRVSDRHWSRRYLPNVAVGCQLENEITDLSLCVRVQGIDLRRRVVRDNAERIETGLAVRVIAPAFNNLDRAIKERSNPFRLGNIVF